MTYSQLTTLTSYSFLESTIKISDYVEFARNKCYKSIGISDRNVWYGALEFYNACQQVKLKPILGLLLEYYSNSTRKNHEIFLYAKNLNGYKELIKLSSKKMIENHVLLENLSNGENLFGILPEENEITELMKNRASIYFIERRITRLLNILGQKNLFYGVNSKSKKKIVDWFKKRNISEIACSFITNLKPEESLASTVMKYSKEGKQIKSEEDLFFERNYLMEEKKISKWYEINYPEALINNERIVKECFLDIKMNQVSFPKYPLKRISSQNHLRKICQEFLIEKVPNYTSEYELRLNYELSVIHKMGFDDYFLIVWDIVDFCHRIGISIGPGRGSSAGSLVAYILSITDVDPIKYKLIFERFLNPQRQNMPDIDLDIPDNRRQEIFKYVKQKYGLNHVAHICTFGSIGAKMALKDVTQVFGLSQDETSLWLKLIPKSSNRFKVELKTLYEKSFKFRKMVNASKTNQRIFKVASIIEGLPRHISTHASGLVIKDKSLQEIVPLQKGSEHLFLTQFTMKDIENLGLLKIDFLGLRSLSIIDNIQQEIRLKNRKFSIQKEIKLDDEKTLKLFQRGETIGVFQFDSIGIRDILRRINPKNIEEIASTSALYRPGPIKNIDKFVRRKMGKEMIEYPDSTIRSILGNTYGVLIYQEQIMQLVSKMANFSLVQADTLRQAISKKEKNLINRYRNQFLNQAVKNNYKEETAKEVYNYIEKFASYGFNRSHAIAYSFISFQMAYLKTHFPSEFFKCLIQSMKYDLAKVNKYIHDAKKQGMFFFSPCINRSRFGLVLADLNEIYFGLDYIKNLPKDFIEIILKERKRKGIFKSLDDFLIRLNQKYNKYLKEEYIFPLIYIGAFDLIEPNRKKILLDFKKKVQNIIFTRGNKDLLKIMSLKEKKIMDFSLEEKMNLNKKYLGICFDEELKKNFRKKKLEHALPKIIENLDKKEITILFFLKSVKEIRSKSGELTAILDGNDFKGNISIIIPCKLYHRIKFLLKTGELFVVNGRIKVELFPKYTKREIFMDNIYFLKKITRKNTEDRVCFIRILKNLINKQYLDQLSTIFLKHKGNIPIILYYKETREKILLNPSKWIDHNLNTQLCLENLFGKKNVIFKKDFLKKLKK